MFYGVISLAYLRDAAYEVADCIGHGANRMAAPMLVETCAAETQCGEYRDPTPNGAGRGATQVDEKTFYWLQKKYGNSAIAKRLIQRFGIDITRVTHPELDYNPLLALIFARLLYWTVTEPIPVTRAGRAAYWKKHYNTSAGKGDEQHFLTAAQRCLGDEHV